MVDKNEVELAYDDAMEASNELGYACMTPGDVIRHQADELVQLRNSIPVRKMGCYGAAYDSPEDCRAYSYKDQPDNQGAYRIGLAANNLKQPCGDLIDKGLALLAELEAQGYGIFEMEKKKKKRER